MAGRVRGKRIGFLASVTSADEARVALAGGADVIDAKDPGSGALGRLPAPVIVQIVSEVAGRVPVSATIGDVASQAELVIPAVREVAAFGVDIVKIGLFGGGDTRTLVAALGDLDLGRQELVAVLLADQGFDDGIVGDLADAGFAGVMLDTARKDGRGLLDHVPLGALNRFVLAAQERGLFAGLAGSLRVGDVPALCANFPDILGFRGALCVGGRATRLDAVRVRAVRSAIDVAAAYNHDVESMPA